MLTDTLLDSSPAREPLLKGRHWLTMVAAAVAGFCLGWFGLPLVETPQAKVLATQSLVLAVAFFFSALMLVHVHVDSRHLGLRTRPWMVLTFLLNVVGFVAYLVYSAARTNDWKRAALPIAYMIEVLAIGVMVIIPLVYTQALPEASFSFVFMPGPPRAAPPPAAAPRNFTPVSIEDLEKTPALVPKAIATIRGRFPAASKSVVWGSVPGIGPGGPSDGVIDNVIAMTATPPPPPKAKPQAAKRVLQGGDVEAAKLIYVPKPGYPQLARMARIQGTVRLAALIAADGTVKHLRVISGHPLLVKAALEAVEKWRYQPTLLNGDPVEVETEIDVNFALAQ